MDIDSATVICTGIADNVLQCLSHCNPENKEEIVALMSTAVIMMCTEIASAVGDSTPDEETQVLKDLQEQIFAGLEFVRTPEGRIMLEAEGAVH